MNSTNDDTVPDTMGALFDDVILPAAARLQAKGGQPFPLHHDPALQSYYVPRVQPAMKREDFTAPSCLDIDEFALCLTAHWKARGRDDLLEAVPRIAAAARSAHAALDKDAKEQPDDEVSPFIYVMF
jgi:hypothetical protein